MNWIMTIHKSVSRILSDIVQVLVFHTWWYTSIIPAIQEVEAGGL
jgi:hypothetical protein